MVRRLLWLLALAALAAFPVTAQVRVLVDGVEHLASPGQKLDVNFGSLKIGGIIIGCFSLNFPAGSEGGTIELEDSSIPPFYISEPLVKPLPGSGGIDSGCAGSQPDPGGFPVQLTGEQQLKLVVWAVPQQVGAAADTLALRVKPKNGTAHTVVFNSRINGLAATPCVGNQYEMCLNGGRFRVQAAWSTGNGESAAGQVQGLTDDSGYLFFFNPANIEAVVKILDACEVNDRYWVFAGGLTNVRTLLSVTDTQQGRVKTYINPLGRAFQPIQDTAAFATCP
jgi:hypothetical protein